MNVPLLTKYSLFCFRSFQLILHILKLVPKHFSYVLIYLKAIYLDKYSNDIA